MEAQLPNGLGPRGGDPAFRIKRAPGIAKIALD
jgi:hypothetical protein